MEKNYITPFGLNELLREQEFLLKMERPKIVKVVTWAASLGDRSENADYIYGKKRLREIDKRLRFLGKRIDNAYIVDPKKNKSNVIQFGATVKVIDEEGIEKDYIIIGVDEINVDKGLISWKSPIGKSLLGKEVGDLCQVNVPKGAKELEIVGIEYKDIDSGYYKKEKWEK